MKKNELKMKEFSHVALFFILVFLICLLGAKKCSSQCYTYQPKQTTENGAVIFFGAGISNGYFAHELHAGYRVHNTSLTAGYISLPNNTQPALLQLRAGYNITQRWHVYAGAVHILYSTDDKSRNKTTWATGIQFHTFHFDRGTVYTSVNYSPVFVTATVGVSYNLMKED